MEKIKSAATKITIKAQTTYFCFLNKLKNTDGGLMEYLIVILFAVVLGAVLLKRFGTTMDTTMNTTDTRINEMFNYK